MTLRHDIMHKDVELYVYDMIAISESEKDHTIDLWKLFKRPKRIQLQLNLAKYTFGIRSRNLLGFMVCYNGIKVNLKKAHAVLEILIPDIENEF